MMQIYKQRDFGELISDTFNFFKEHGKNYFKNYFLLNGILLTILVVLYVVGYRGIFSQMFSSNIGGQSYYFEQYFQENGVVLGILGLLFFLLFFATMFVSYLYPVFYMKWVAEKGSPNITANDIMSDLKKNVGKFFIFILVMMFVMLPLMAILFSFSAFLMIILIGFILMLLLFPSVVNAVNLMLFDYFSTSKGVFSSLSYGIRSQFSYCSGNRRSPFWKYWGSTFIIFVIVQIVSGVLMIVPMVLMMTSVMAVPDAAKSQAMDDFFGSTMGIIYFIFYGLTIAVSFVMMNFIYVNAGLMYYDSRLDLHRNEQFSEIDTIGIREA